MQAGLFLGSVAVALVPWAARGAAGGPAEAHRLVLANSVLARDFAWGPGWRTIALRCPQDGWRLQADSEELVVELRDGTRIAGPDWQLLGAPRLRRLGEAQELTVCLLTQKAPGLKTYLTYRVRAQESWMRKQVVLQGPPGMVVTRLDLEPMVLSPAPPDQGGEGMPLVVSGRCWLGVEYPASHNSVRRGRLSLVHYPGWDLAKGELASKTAVWGLAPPGQHLRLAFEDYLTTVAVPPRDFLHYNSWYDLRGPELTPQRLLEVYQGFADHLLRPYRLQLAAFVIDDGWQEPRSIWRPRREQFPQGFAPLAHALESRGTRLGLWMPFSGQNLDVSWGAGQGYEKSDRGNFYCLAAPRYYAAMRAATARLIREGHLAYYKHDFNYLRCSAAGHEHLPTDPHGHEANVDRTIALLQYERSLNPAIFLNVTSGMWYSPWWLMYADAIWGGFPGDTGYERSWPQLTPREWDSSFRDVHLYRMYCQQPNNFFPISRLMTHGITQGRYNMLGGQNEPLREWADHVMLYFGRGVQMKELYLSPERMRPDMWKAVGTAVRWAQRRAPILARTVMIGGDPSQGKAFAYVHFLGDRGVWVLRNPDLGEQTLRVPIGQETGYRGQAKRLYAAVTYPYASPLPDILGVGREARVWLPPASVVVVEVRPQPWGEPAGLPELRAQVSRTAASSPEAVRISVRAGLAAGAHAPGRLYVVLRGGAKGPCQIHCPGAGESQTASGPTWCMTMLPFGSLPADLQLSLEIPRGQRQPFTIKPGRVEVWLVADLPCEERQLLCPPPDLPWALGAGTRRRSIKLLDLQLPPTQALQPLSDADLAQLRAAKLHLEVFGVQGGPYADKWIWLNGHKLARIPFNDPAQPDQWEERVVELDAESLKYLQRDNAVVLTNEPGDCYKVRDLALAVQLPDGRWVESEWERGVHCSVASWLYTEGQVFEAGRSREIHLRFLRP
jgi:hypothetical protein